MPQALVSGATKVAPTGPRTITHDELCRQLGRSPLRYLRLQAGLSQTRLAQKTGLSQSYLARIEAGQRQPSASTRKKLARTLGVAEDKLVF